MLGAILILPQQVCSMDTKQTTRRNTRTTPNNATAPSSNTDNTFFGIPLKYISCLGSAFFSTNLWSDSSHEQGTSASTSLSELSPEIPSAEIESDNIESTSTSTSLSTQNNTAEFPPKKPLLEESVISQRIFSYCLPRDAMAFGSVSKTHRNLILGIYRKIMEKADIQGVTVSYTDGIGTDSNGNPCKAFPQLYVFDPHLNAHTSEINDPFIRAIILTRLGLQKLVNFNRSNFTPTALRELAENGCIEAQSRVAQGLAKGENGIAQNPTELRQLADRGWPIAQKLVAEGVAKDFYGFPQNPVELRELADLGWVKAQEFVVEGLEKGLYGFYQNHYALRELAEDGWSIAQLAVANGLAKGSHGFSQSRYLLRELADLGWLKAQELVAEGLAKGIYGFPQDTDALRELADLGWVKAQEFVVEGIVKAIYGFPQDPVELRVQKLTNMSESLKIFAERIFSEGLAKGTFGFVQNPYQLIQIADRGWVKAKELVAEGLALGKYGFLQHPVLLKKIAEKNYYAQRFVIEGLALGKYGFQKDLVALRDFLAIHRKNRVFFDNELLSQLNDGSVFMELYMESLEF